MKRGLILIVLVMSLPIYITSCGHFNGNLSTETETTEELTAATEKVSEIVTEAPTTELQTTEVITEEITTETWTEEYDADGDGYGWIALQYSEPYEVIENHLTKSNGVVYYNGHKETWYSIYEPGQTVTARDIPGKHIADDGTIRDCEGYICVASSDLDFYTIVLTTVGPGKVYDCGCSSGTIDVYTTW